DLLPGDPRGRQRRRGGRGLLRGGRMAAGQNRPHPHTPDPAFQVFGRQGVTHGPQYRRARWAFQEASVRPPSTMIVWPVMCRAASLHRNETTRAMSSGSATRPRIDSCSARSSTSAGSLVSSSVLTKPGATAFTLMLDEPRSTAADLVSPISAALLAA